MTDPVMTALPAPGTPDGEDEGDELLQAAVKIAVAAASITETRRTAPSNR
jgi:hypothetical protein